MLSRRTEELLKLSDEASRRTRYVVIVLNLFSVLIAGVMLNEKYGATLSRIETRLWTSQVAELQSEIEPIPAIDKVLIEKDKLETEFLTRMQMMEFEKVDIPIIGISIAAADAGFIAAFAGIVIYLWFWYGSNREQSIVANIVYPLVDKETDPEYKMLWQTDKSGSAKSSATEYRREVSSLREVLASQFLFLNSQRVLGGEILAKFMLIMPVLLLTILLVHDFVWDFVRQFPESGGKTYVEELRTHQEKLESDARKFIDQGNTESAAKVQSIANRIEKQRTTLLVKRYTTFPLILALAFLAFQAWTSSTALSRVLTDMYTGKLSDHRFTILKWLNLPRSHGT